MTSLSEAYEPGAEFETSLRRLYLGVGLFLLGAVAVVLGIAAATTNLLVSTDASVYAARKLAGTLAGLGLPAVFLGVFVVLPAGKRTRGAAIIGAAVAVLGVALFQYAYPELWRGANYTPTVDLTFPTTAVYFAGTIVTVWALFVGVANFKSRNDPQGTVEMEVSRQGETRVIEVPAAQAEKFGGVGTFGDPPEGDVPTQTNGTASDGRGQPTGDGGRSAERITEAGTAPGTDGATDARSTAGVDRVDGIEPTNPGKPGPGSKPTGRSPSAGETHDRYCGTCRHFRYVRTEEGMRPYCGAHETEMEDMTACEDWRGRGER